MKNLPLIIALSTLLGCSNSADTDANTLTTKSTDYAAKVYPHLDSANSRWFFFDSAARPFGLVNLNPDTELGGAWGSGYRYHSDTIKGFSHIHAWQLAGLSVLPVVSDKPLREIRGDYFSAYSHDNETVSPGYHQVTLDRYGINAELTATTRVGMHRYHFPADATPRIFFKLTGQLGPVDLGEAHIKQLSDTTLAGYITNDPTKRRPKATPVFFYIELDHAMTALHVADRGNSDVVTDYSGHRKDAMISFAKTDQPIQMKVGVSYTSIDGAKANMAAELDHWNFDIVKADARNEWNEWLGKIDVKGGTEQQQRRFYTDLWHALQGRRIISDVDGRYSDQTGATRQVKQLALDTDGKAVHAHYNSDSFWGAQWTISTLWPLAYPQTAADMGSSLMTYYKDGGIIPRGPSGGNYTYVMTGASSTPFLVSNAMKGVSRENNESLFAALEKNHNLDGIMTKAGYEHTTSVGGGLKYYLERGYIPYPIAEDADPSNGYHFHWKGAGQTMEYSLQDHTLSQFALKLGKTAQAEQYRLRSLNYRNLYDPESGFIRPKEMDGNWRTPFDPYDYEKGYVESNASQMTWFATHDYDGLAKLMGGKEALIDKLNTSLETAAERGFTSAKSHADEKNEQGRRIPINYGNQPSMQAAFIFNSVGAPWLTQKWSREVANTVFGGLNPDTGYNGDEDQGLMGSLAVLMKIGLFQLTAGTEQDPIYWIGSPLFDEITIQLDERYYDAKQFVIKANNNSDTNRYIQSITLNGNPLDRVYIKHSEIVAGATLELEMGAEPNKALAAN